MNFSETMMLASQVMKNDLGGTLPIHRLFHWFRQSECF